MGGRRKKSLIPTSLVAASSSVLELLDALRLLWERKLDVLEDVL